MKAMKTGRGRLVFLLWLLIAVFYFIGVSNYIGVAMDDTEFEEYLQRAVNLIASQNQSPDDLRSLVVAKAHELDIPLDPVNIAIDGRGSAIELTVHYDVIIEFPLLRSAAYRREFEHQVGYDPFE